MALCRTRQRPPPLYYLKSHILEATPLVTASKRYTVPLIRVFMFKSLFLMDSDRDRMVNELGERVSLFSKPSFNLTRPQ